MASQPLEAAVAMRLVMMLRTLLLLRLSQYSPGQPSSPAPLSADVKRDESGRPGS